MSTLFDTYVMVDWSAASSPKTGADSIWIHVLVRHGGTVSTLALDNPATRHAAGMLLRSWLQQFVAEKRRVLVGFDFPLGYPFGFAAQLGLSGPPWRAVWDLLAARLTDDADNTNNRFDLASDLNAQLTGEAFPFWGCPPGRSYDRLTARRTRRHGAGDLAERRVADRRDRRLKSIWQVFGAGSVGGQALTGIPQLRMLRTDRDLAAISRVWPFETGFRVPERDIAIVFAEVYPSMVEPYDHPIRDAGQVLALAHHFATLDAEDLLALHFSPDLALTATERRMAEREEGWVLGLGRSAATRPVDYLRDAAAIYSESWRKVREATDLDQVDADLRGVAVRLVHTAGDPTVIIGLAQSLGAVDLARAALAAGAPILVDAEMVAAGITRRFLTAGNEIVCTLNHPSVPGLAQHLATTRSAAAVDLWGDRLAGAVVAIGNAPTALFRLLELLDAGAPPPAVILGFPVGFVGAAEAKQALMARDDVPWIALAGTRGGSALAAAAVNALAAEDQEIAS